MRQFLLAAHVLVIFLSVAVLGCARGGGSAALAASARTSAVEPQVCSGTHAAEGQVTFTLDDGHIYRVAARPDATPEDVSAGLERLAHGSTDDWLNTAADGSCLLASSDRFADECRGWPCLALVRPDLSAFEVIRVNGAVVRADSFSAVASAGSLVVYVDGGGPHARDLWAIARSADGWSAPLLLTGRSPYAFNTQPALASDGSRVVFDCGDQPYAAEGTALCTAATNGSRFAVALRPADTPAGLPRNGALHHPGIAADGSLVFEGDWGVEQVWRLAPGVKSPALIAPSFTNDNSPCVLPDGRVVSLWYAPDASPSVHQLKLMAADGTPIALNLSRPGTDVADIGIGCSG